MEKQHSLSRKLAFAAADIYGGGSFNIVNFLYPGFLALTVGISPFWISFVVLVARIWDAITDPLMGFISDRTQSRLGKRRIYLVIASPLVLASMYLMFFPFQINSEILRVIAVLTSYLVFATVQTMVMIPYYSLSSQIAKDYQQRASYNSYRLGFSIFSSILCVAVPGIIVGMFDDAAIGYQVMSISFGTLFGLSVLVSGLFAREEITTTTAQNTFSIKELVKPLQLRPFRQYLGMFLVLQMAMAIMSGLFFFYADFYLARDLTAAGEGNIIGLISAALMFSMQIVALPIYLKMIEKHSKTYAYRVGAIVWIIAALALLLVPANTEPWIIFPLAAIMGLGISGPGLVPHTMYGDVVDVGQLHFGERLDGQMSGFTNFINKVAQAIGLALIMLVIGFYGFQEQIPGGAPITAQPDSAVNAIRYVLAFAPLLLMGIGIYISYRYKVSAKKQAEVLASLENNGENAKTILESL